ncbi:hypothetical protein [Cupriavidus campinensis]|uniref:hypothetical protein n=1 Tax=Cupriavidus campinensis TaxID=151783 RepID=UPI00165685D6|nr:hypothetical protein [Cupriavidus campinensis]
MNNVIKEENASQARQSIDSGKEWKVCCGSHQRLTGNRASTGPEVATGAERL